LSLVRLLPFCGDAEALSALKTACADSNQALRDSAIRALADWPDAASWDALTAIYRQSDNEAHRVLSLRALARLAEERNVRPDARLLNNYQLLLNEARRDEERTLVLAALSGVAHPDALNLVIPLLSNPNLQAEAEMALKKIAASIKDQHPTQAREALDKLK
jgi:HEAT repeat protein